MANDPGLDADSLSWVGDAELAAGAGVGRTTTPRAKRERGVSILRPALTGAARKQAILLGLTLSFALLGQFYFSRVSAYPWDGVALYVASAVCLVLLARTLEVQPREREALRPRSLRQALLRFAREDPRRAALYGIATLAALRVVQQLRSLPDNADHYPTLYVWILGIIALAAALSLPRDTSGLSVDWRALGSRIYGSMELRLVVALVATAFLLRALWVDTLPANFGGDEGTMALSAVAILEGRVRNLFGTGWSFVPNLFFWFESLSMKIFGDSIFGVRMLQVIAGTAAVAFCYLLVKQLFGLRLALAAAALLATYHFHIHYSRLVANNVEDSFLFLAVFCLLLKGMESGRRGWFAAGGIMLGLTQYFYFGGRLIPLLVLLYLGYLLLADRELVASRLRGLLGMGSMALLVALPYLTYVSRHPGVYMARANQIGIFPSGWYDRELAMGRDAVSVLTEQAMRSVLAFNYFPDKVYWYHPGIPLLDFFSSIFFAFGLVYATWHLLDRRYFVIAASYWLALFTGAFLTENPPSSMRLVILAPMASILVAIGMTKTVEWSWKVLSPPKMYEHVALAGLVAVASIISIGFYFGEYSKHRTEGYGGPNTEVATEMAWYLKGLGTDYRIYFFGAPRMFLDFSTIPYIARGIQGTDVRQPLSGPPSFVGPERQSVFVFLPERRRELEALKQFVPGGTEEEIRGKELGQPLFVAYRVEREARAGSPPQR